MKLMNRFMLGRRTIGASAMTVAFVATMIVPFALVADDPPPTPSWNEWQVAKKCQQDPTGPCWCNPDGDPIREAYCGVRRQRGVCMSGGPDDQCRETAGPLPCSGIKVICQSKQGNSIKCIYNCQPNPNGDTCATAASYCEGLTTAPPDDPEPIN